MHFQRRIIVLLYDGLIIVSGQAVMSKKERAKTETEPFKIHMGRGVHK